MIDLSRDGEVFVLRMDADENRFHPNFVRAWNRALDDVERAEGAKALVTVGSGKFDSNGLDLDWMLGEGQGSAGDSGAAARRRTGGLDGREGASGDERAETRALRVGAAGDGGQAFGQPRWSALSCGIRAHGR
jgi:enoyl-CoA hydratase/carnithine racemase